MILKFAIDYVSYLNNLIDAATAYMEFTYTPGWNPETTSAVFDPADVIKFINFVLWERDKFNKAISEADRSDVTDNYAVYCGVESALRKALDNMSSDSSEEFRADLLSQIHDIAKLREEAYTKEMKNVLGVEVEMYNYFTTGDSFEEAITQYLEK